MGARDRAAKALDAEADALQLLTAKEVAALLRVHEKPVRRLAAGNSLPCIRIGSRVRFAMDDVLRCVSARREE